VDTSKNQFAAAGADALGEAEDGPESFAAQHLQIVEIEDDAFGAGTEKVAAVSFEQARRGVVEAALGGDHFGMFQLPVGKNQHGDLLSTIHYNYPSFRRDPQPAGGNIRATPAPRKRLAVQREASTMSCVCVEKEPESRMSYPIEKKFVVAVSSTVLFDLSHEHALYLEKGLEEFRRYQHEHRHDVPKPGVGFPFIRRLLMLNRMYPEEHPVEVVILSRYHADDGMRVMDAVREYGLDITRAFFMAGRKPYPFMESVNASLYLSTNAEQVKEAVSLGYPAGHVLPCAAVDDEQDPQLRIAFDFDGVLVDDEAEKVYKKMGDLEQFRQYELENRDRPLKAGPLMPLLQQLSYFQQMDIRRAQDDSGRKRLLRISIVTARGAPAHERLNTTLSALGLEADEVFLMGGIEKKRVLDILKPHLFFDDQLVHLAPVAASTPSVHVPFGVANTGAG